MLPAIAGGVKCVALQKERKKHGDTGWGSTPHAIPPLEKFPIANRTHVSIPSGTGKHFINYSSTREGLVTVTSLLSDRHYRTGRLFRTFNDCTCNYSHTGLSISPPPHPSGFSWKRDLAWTRKTAQTARTPHLGAPHFPSLVLDYPAHRSSSVKPHNDGDHDTTSRVFLPAESHHLV